MVEILRLRRPQLKLSLSTMENVARTLSVVSFLTLCWVAHRSLQPRTQCLNSSVVAFVQIGALRAENCQYESRLSLSHLLHPLSLDQESTLRALESVERLREVFNLAQPTLAVEVNLEAPHLFELGTGYVRLGREWLNDQQQTARALTMGLLKQQYARTELAPFQLEVLTDFLMLTVLQRDDWGSHSLRRDIRFSTASPSFVDYCKSPFRSLTHHESCLLEKSESDDMQADVWGFEPLLAVALLRVFEKIALVEKIQVLQHLRDLPRLPLVPPLEDETVASRSQWLERALRSHLEALGILASATTDFAVKQTWRELDVSAPTHWELTVDLLNTPAWREIVMQFRQWSKLHPHDRILVFTPESTIALPADLPVAWAASEIQTQKHVLIACQWPRATEALNIQARHIYARQTCAKVDQVFWN